jgi:adenosine kinase
MRRDREKKLLVVGATAIDLIGFYPSQFKQYEKEYRPKNLNVSFQLAELERSYGGCAMNIAFGLARLDIKGFPFSTIGKDFFEGYQEHVEAAGINTKYLEVRQETGATCLMINDQSGNQIIGFYPGSGTSPKEIPEAISSKREEISLCFIAPQEPDLTLNQAAQMKSLDIPVMVDTGQVSAEYSKQDIKKLLELVDYIIVNENELEVLKINANLNEKQFVEPIVEAIITRGEDGVDIISKTARSHIHSLEISESDFVDATGCGDAFRAGFVFGFFEGANSIRAAQLGCLMAAANIKSLGAQNFDINPEKLRAQREFFYGEGSDLVHSNEDDSR